MMPHMEIRAQYEELGKVLTVLATILYSGDHQGEQHLVRDIL